MLRLLSLLLMLAGAAVAALGYWLYQGNEIPAGWLGQSEIKLERKVLEPESAPPPPPEAVVMEEPVEAAPPPPPPPPQPPVPEPEAMPAPASEPPRATSSSTTARSRSLTAPAPQSAGEAGTEGAMPAPEAVREATPAPSVGNVLAVDEPTFVPEAAPIVAVPEPTIEEKLYSVPIAYETPPSASFNQPFIVTLAINAQEGAETATGGLSGSTTTNVEEATVQVTDQVKASLFGEAFVIAAKSPEIQKLSKSTESRWRWEVLPTKSGPQELTFEIFAMHEGDASELVRTFDDTVTVEVSRIGQAMFLAQQYNPLIVIFAGIGSLLAGLFGVLRFFRGN